MSILSVSRSLSDESRVFNFLTSKTCKIRQLVKRGGELLIFFIVGLCIGHEVRSGVLWCDFEGRCSETL